jgi:protein SCO1/2
MKAAVAMLAFCGLFAAAAYAGAAAVPDGIADRIGFEQRLNADIPPGLRFRDEHGADVRMGTYFGRSPIVLVFAYFGCSSLCPTVIGNLAQTLDRTGMAAGSRYQVIVASIDPGDSPTLAAMKKAAYLSGVSRTDTGDGWHLLTGSPANIAALADAAGFRYTYDVRSHQYMHPAGIIVLTPQGTIARYFFGFDFTPDELISALDAAAAKRISSPVQSLLLRCFHLEPGGKHSIAVIEGLRWAALAMSLALAVAFVAARWSSRDDAASRRRDW